MNSYLPRRIAFLFALIFFLGKINAIAFAGAKADNYDTTKHSPSKLTCTSKSTEGVFILCEKREGKFTSITNDLFIVSEISSNQEHPVELRGPYQCQETTSLYRLSKPGLLNENDIFLNLDFKKIASTLIKEAKKNKIQVFVDDAELIEIIKNSQFRFLNKKDFNLINSYSITDSCQVDVFEKPLPTKIIFPFLSDYLKSQLK